MPGQVTLDELAEALSRSDPWIVDKLGVANQLAYGWTSLWRVGALPAIAAIPAAAANPTDATLGALGVIPSIGIGERGLLSLVAMQASGNCLVQVIDRLAHMGGLSGIVASPTAQTVNASVVALAGARCAADYSNVRWGIEIYTDIGTTGRTATVAYTDGAGNPQTTTLTLGGASPANRAARFFPIYPSAAAPLAGIRSVETVTLSATTGTAGNFGVTAYRVLSPLGLVATQADVFGWDRTGAPEVFAGSCLSMLIRPSATTTPTLYGSVTVGVG